jgi:hypothetical protein
MVDATGVCGAAVSDRPIIFSAPMVRALLDGRKTQTRRTAWRWVKDRGDRHLSNDDADGCHQPSPWQRVQPGDTLWVRETWCPVADAQHGEADWVDYRASPRYAAPGVSHPAGWEQCPGDPQALRWRSPIHMPRWASRLTLHVEAVRVERLWNMTEADAIAEGVTPSAQNLSGHPLTPHVAAFSDLWLKLHGPAAWASNPEVVVLTFRTLPSASGSARLAD